MSLTTAKADKGLKRICGSCATRFYDFNKSPIFCPKCGEEFTGAAKIKARRSRKSADDIANDKPVKQKVSKVKDKNLDDIDNLDDDDEDLDTDIDLDELANIDDSDDDDYEDGDDLDLSRVTSD
jgi:uncharacterized protein (TIGR02300 family)